MNQDNSLESPLESLCSTPADKMTPQQRLDQITKIRKLRDNHHAYKKWLAGEGDEEKKDDVFGDF